MTTAKNKAIAGRSSRPASGYTIHRIKSDNGWSYPEHKHNNYGELVCATHGEFKHCINGEATVQRAGEIVYIREADVHALRGVSFSYVNVMFSDEWLLRLEQYLESPGMSEMLIKPPGAPRAMVPLDERTAFGHALEQLLSNSSSDAGRGLFAQFLLKVFAQYLVPLHKPSLSADLPDWLRETLVWLGEQHEHFPTLADVVKHSCRCHEHFTREFSRLMCMTPSNYLAKLKIERASKMLVTSNLKLKEICRVSGFENESYFFRLFRKSKGITPLEYRRTYGRNSIQR